MSTPRPVAAAAAVIVVAIVAGCTGSLPPQDRVDKLRVLAVRAEPPEIRPGQTTVLDSLSVTPPADANATAPVITYLWLVCQEVAGAQSPGACGITTNGNGGPDAFGSSDPTAGIPLCDDAPDAELCLAGTGRTARYTPSAATLGVIDPINGPAGGPGVDGGCVDRSSSDGGDGGGDADGGVPTCVHAREVIVTAVISDEPGGAIACATDAAGNGTDAPSDPDHCIIAIKRLTISDNAAPNHNPQLKSFRLGMKPIAPAASSQVQFTVGSTDPLIIEAARCNAADIGVDPACAPGSGSEFELDGTYEPLFISWFASAGDFEDSRTDFQDADCDPTCMHTDPLYAITDLWTPPDSDDASQFVHDGEIDFWAVVRDDRGGTGWIGGRALQAPSTKP